MSTPKSISVPDYASVAGKTVLITGGTGGLGRETILLFAKHTPQHIFFTGRSSKSASSVIDAARQLNGSIKISFVACDLSSLSSVREASQQLLASMDHLDILIANAGGKTTTPGLTKDGYEIDFGTNHVGHALLVQMLMPKLEATAAQSKEARIVWLSSQASLFHPLGGIQFDKLKTPMADAFGGSSVRYAQSKLANRLYALAFAQRHPNITSVAVHPGVAWTGIISPDDWAMRLTLRILTFGKILSPQECAYNQAWAATAPKGSKKGEVQSGSYYEPLAKHVNLGRCGEDVKLADRLWDWTVQELGSYKSA